jgi:hypothetical protein
MRWGRLDRELVESLVAAPEARAEDLDGNPILFARDAEGRLVKIVVALDDPGFVITVITKER